MGDRLILVYYLSIDNVDNVEEFMSEVMKKISSNSVGTLSFSFIFESA